MDFLNKLLKHLLGFGMLGLGAYLNDLTPTNLSNAIPTIWDKKIRIDSARKSFWGKFVGKEGSDQPIIERMDFTQEPGNTININIASQLIQEGQTGDSTLEGNEEKFTLGQIAITPNVLRHAVAVNWRTKKQINFNSIEAIGNMLSTWLARRTDEDHFNEIINNNAPAIMYAGNATTRATLGASSTFGVAEIDRIKIALQRQGALPIRTVMDGKQEIDWYGIVISETDEYSLKLDAVWNAENQNAGPRDYGKNRIFSGALGYHNGVWIYTHTAVKFGGRYGSYLRPEASPTTAMAAGDTTITVGTNANVNYTKFFPTSGTVYIEYGTSNFEAVSYTGTTNTTFTGCTRAQEGTTAVAHAVGTLITLRNLGRAIGFGAEISARAWGQLPTRITDVRDYGYEQGIGIMAYYGQRAIANSSGTMPNSIIMETFSPNPNATI